MPNKEKGHISIKLSISLTIRMLRCEVIDFPQVQGMFWHCYSQSVLFSSLMISLLVCGLRLVHVQASRDVPVHPRRKSGGF